VLVLGGGYAGVTLTRDLEDRLADEHDVVLVDDDGTHLVQHELHRVVRRPALSDEISVDLAAVLGGATVRVGSVASIETEDRVVLLEDGERLDYDVCAVCLGAEPAMGVPGVREHATPLKRVEHARRIHERAVAVLESGGAAAALDGDSAGEDDRSDGEDAAPADSDDRSAGDGGKSTGDGSESPGDSGESADPGAEPGGEPGGAAAEPTAGGVDPTADRGESPADASESTPDRDGADTDAGGHRIVVGGAGLSGVQVAGELAALAEAHGRVVGADAEVVLLERESAVAPGFGDAFQAAIHGTLEERGIEVRTGSRIERVTADAVVTAAGRDLAHDQLVWTGGITGASALGGERPQVDARLLLDDRTFGVGDAVRVVDRDGQAVPASAQAAVREARTVASNVERLVEGDDGVFDPRLERFTFDSPGWVVSVGDGAVAQVGPTVVTGRAAVALKATVGVGYLSTVGALREAVDLVNEELGLAVEED